MIKADMSIIEAHNIAYHVGLKDDRIPFSANGLQRLIRIFNTLKAVRKVNTEGVPLFESVSFNLLAGKTLLVSAPANSGKTVLSRILAGALLPSSGEIIIRKSFAPVIGGMKLLAEEASCIANVFYVAAMSGLGKNEMTPLVLRILEWAKIADGRKKIYELKYIQKISLLLSVALHLPADIILIDGLLDKTGESLAEKICSRIEELRLKKISLLLTSRHSSFKFPIDVEVKLISHPKLSESRRSDSDTLDVIEEECSDLEEGF